MFEEARTLFSRYGLLIAPFLLWLLHGCTQITEPGSPDYSITCIVQGTVTDAATGLALEGVLVTCAEKTALTDAAGTYSISDLPLGKSVITYYLKNFTTVVNKVDFLFPSEEGWTGDRKVSKTKSAYMYEKDAGLKLTLYGSAKHELMAGVDVILDLGDFIVDSSIDVEGVTNSSGVVTFSGLPAKNIRLIALPFDYTGDGVVDYETKVGSVNLMKEKEVAVTERLEIDSGKLIIVWSNLQDDPVLEKEQSIRCIFSEAMDRSENATDVSIMYAATLDEIRVSSIWEDAVTIRIQPDGNLLPGEQFLLGMSATSLTGRDISANYQFATEGIIDTLTDVTYLELETTEVDWNTTTLKLRWDTVENADSYSVYARNSGRISSWIKIGSYKPGILQEMVREVTLSTLFDYYNYDPDLTPFTYGLKVEFTVTPATWLGKENPLTGPYVFAQDNTEPFVNENDLKYDGTFDNSGEAMETEAFVYINFPEYMFQTATPSVSFSEAGGDSTYVLPSSAATWEWDRENPTKGCFLITIPADTDASDDVISIGLDGIEDSSGNPCSVSSVQDTLPDIGQFNYFCDFEAYLDPAYWTTWSSTQYGRVECCDFDAYMGQQMVIMDVTTQTYNSNSLTLTLDLSHFDDESRCVVSFYYNTYGDELSYDHDFVEVSGDGSNWARILTFQNTGSAWKGELINLQPYYSTAPFTSTYMIRWNQRDNNPWSTDGIGIDNVQLLAY